MLNSNLDNNLLNTHLQAISTSANQNYCTYNHCIAGWLLDTYKQKSYEDYVEQCRSTANILELKNFNVYSKKAFQNYLWNYSPKLGCLTKRK